jgi:light-regulated signal transduction histidine kinase (bacteriophytochrome)
MLSLMRDGSGEVSGVAVIMRDITGRKVAERALQNLNVELERKITERTASLHAANEHLQSFAFSVSHDLRAPLRAIDGFAQALDESIVDLDAANRERIYRMRGSTKRMAALIDSLLQLSRLGQVQVAAESHDVGEMVNAVMEEIRAEYPNVTFKRNALGESDGDPSLLRQVWVNLIGNAAKFSSKSGNPMVEIDRVEHAGERIFVVKDNGAGFDMQYAGKLFGLFQRMHRQDEFPGTGAGLAIVKRIVELHGGRIWAESDTGKGASFYFTLNPKLVVKTAAMGPKGQRSIPL